MTRQDWLNAISDCQDVVQELGSEIPKLSASGQFHLLFLAESLRKMWKEFPHEGTPPDVAESRRETG